MICNVINSGRILWDSVTRGCQEDVEDVAEAERFYKTNT